MLEHIQPVNATVSLPIRAILLTARFSGRVRQRSLKRPVRRDVDAKTREIFFLKDRVCQLEMQLSILQTYLNRKDRSRRHAVHERLLIL